RTSATPDTKGGVPMSASVGRGRIVSATCSIGSAQRRGPARQRRNASASLVTVFSLRPFDPQNRTTLDRTTSRAAVATEFELILPRLPVETLPPRRFGRDQPRCFWTWLSPSPVPPRFLRAGRGTRTHPRDGRWARRSDFTRSGAQRRGPRSSATRGRWRP